MDKRSTASPRRLKVVVQEDLNKKMVLLSGPRQCGKTTLAKSLGPQAYYNWDITKDRKLLLAGELDDLADLWVLDEIHKDRKWRNRLKGLYDEYHENHRILVTGSAKLGLYSRGGDSLQGRYYQHRLHPFTLSEIADLPFRQATWTEKIDDSTLRSLRAQFDQLILLGGFPEPLLSGSEVEARRWRLNYSQRLIEDEVRSLEQVHDLARLELLLDHLPQTVGSVLSINSLREDLDVSFNTAKKWIEILERLYAVFRIYPFGSPKLKAVKKEAKLYFWDWSWIQNPAARFENLIAVHLLRWVHWQQDVLGEKYELRYFRNTVGHEVDFIVLKDNQPILAVEVKVDDRAADAGIKYLLERLPIAQAFQVSQKGKHNAYGPQFQHGRLRFIDAPNFLARLP